jgi:hypothetical protein
MSFLPDSHRRSLERGSQGPLGAPISGTVLLRRLSLTAVGLAALSLTPPALAGSCGLGSYSYAGLGSRTATSGVSATITPTAASAVRDGHVAGWVGVGGVGEGLHGTNAWIQIGLSSLPGDTTSRIYYEIARPGHKPLYREVRRDVPAGEAHRFVVLELQTKPGWWRAWLDGSPITAPIFLAGSHAHLTAQALGESWSGETGGSCNLYSYGFGHVALADSVNHAWGPVRRFDLFQDGNYRFTRSSLTSFHAASIASESRTTASASP